MSSGFPMLSGLHDSSYAANSGPQNSVLLRCRPLLDDAILQQQIQYSNSTHSHDHIDINHHSSRPAGAAAASEAAANYNNRRHDPIRNHVFRVADMGCSSGPNCLANMQFMLDRIREHRKTYCCATDHGADDEYHRYPLELQAFFCDLPSNDFNTLFQLHAADQYNIRTSSAPGTAAQVYIDHAASCIDGTGNSTARQYRHSGDFFAAVSGTVYGRLFPSSCLDLVFSSCCLHWLSQVPLIVSDPRSSEWNKGKIWVDGPGANKATGRVYAQQCQKDLETFFKCRMEEMVSKGMIFLIILCRPNSFPPHQQAIDQDNCFRCLELAWQQLVHEGVVDQSDIDTFNLPWYLPTPIEIISVANLVPTLRVEKLEVIEEPIGDNYWQQWSNDPSDFAMRQSRFYKSGFWNVIKGHVGIHKCESIFERFERLVKIALENLTSWDSNWAFPWSSYAVVQLFKEI